MLHLHYLLSVGLIHRTCLKILLNFAKISTVQTVASFTLEEYEIGQISDRTIIAEKDLPPDEINPVSILKGEKIIKKGFPITEENYSKLQKMSESPLLITVLLPMVNFLYSFW